jgi:hypothetical protein
MGDVKTFAIELDALASAGAAERTAARDFAARQLDLEDSGAAFARDLRAVLL